MNELEVLERCWNSELKRYKKAVELSKTNPDVFEKYISSFQELCVIMGLILNEYEKLKGEKITEDAWVNGF